MGSAMWWWLASTSYQLERAPKNVKNRARVKRNNLAVVGKNTVAGAGSSGRGRTRTRTSSMIASAESPGKICRVCLKDGEVPIYGTGTDLCEAVKIFGDIQIDEADKFPKYLCDKCHSMLQSAILFRTQAKKTELILQENIKSEAECSVAKKSRLEGHFRDRSAPKSYNIIPTGSAPVAECEEIIVSNKLGPKLICHKIESEFEVKKQCIVSPQSLPDRQEVHLDETGGAKSCTSDYTSQKSMAQHKISKQNLRHSQIRKKTKPSLFEQHTSENESKICDICGKTYKSARGLNSHVLLHSSELPFHCEFCPYRSNTGQNYKIHMRTHTGVKPYVCEECGLGFTTKSNLDRHSLKHKEKQIKCDKCEKSYYSKSDLENHVNSVHLCTREFECEICGNKYRNKKALRKHERRVHKYAQRQPGRKPLYLENVNKP